MKTVDIGNTQTKVIMTHAKRSPLYFIKTFFKKEIKLSPCQEEIIRRLSK